MHDQWLKRKNAREGREEYLYGWGYQGHNNNDELITVLGIKYFYKQILCNKGTIKHIKTTIPDNVNQ